MKSIIIRRKKSAIVVILLLTLYGLSKIELVDYLLMQAAGQVEVLWNARSLDEALEDDTLDESLKANILLVEEIKFFAAKELNLNSEGLYQTIYDQKGKDILWNLSACEPYELKSLEWQFPIVGSVSYKGFFDLNKAMVEEEMLRKNGLDTRIRPVNAWSTLGWFSDPILSNNLSRSKGRIAELFIHEITHANVFIKDSLSFNENLASFIGEQGAKLFMASKYGVESKEYSEYIENEEDVQKFIKHCLNGLNRLDILYKSFNSEWADNEKLEAKKHLIQRWVVELDTINFYDGSGFQGRFKEKLPNNAFFMSFERYDSKKIQFGLELENAFSGDLKSFIEFYKQLE